MVIDGAADQTVGYLDQNVEQATGFERSLDTFLAQCSAESDCAFHNDGHAEDAFDALDDAIDRQPVKTTTGRPDLTQGILDTAIANALYTDDMWPSLATALADLQHGDGEAMLYLYDGYYGRGLDGSYGNQTEAYFAINCLDDPGSKDTQKVFDLQTTLADVAPRLGGSWVQELVFCAEWPVPPAPPVAVDARGAGPIVVVGTTGDPATPLEGTRNMSAALEDGHLIVVTGNQHTGYGVNGCVDAAVDDYLVTLAVPPDGLTCDG